MGPDEEPVLRVLVVGAGPIGIRHARNAVELGHDVAVARRSAAPLPPDAGDLDVPLFSGLDAAAEWLPEAVVVANPPSEHLASASWALERGCSVLIEKPLASGVDGVDEFLDLARASARRVAVAYNLRFHPALRAIHDAVGSGRVGTLLLARAEVGSDIAGWHPGWDYRSNSAAAAELGGGALLTLSHELDYVLWIGGPARLLASARAKVSDLDIDGDDVAELVLRHESGAMSSVHMDLVDTAYNRHCRWVGTEGTIEWSWGGPVLLHTRGGEIVLWTDSAFHLDVTYVDELRAFLAGEIPPGDALDDARRVLEIAEDVRAHG